MSKWSIVKISKFLVARQETPDPEKISSGEYSIISKISFSSGKIELRDHAKTNTNMITIMPGDLVISGINAGKGTIAIYEKGNEKPATATIHYSAYSVDESKADINYLWLFFRSEVFREILRLRLPNGIKTELRPNKFLSLEIPLPPLPEQKRIVAKIKEIEERVKEINGKNRERLFEINSVIDSWLNFRFSKDKWRAIKEKEDIIFATRGKGPEYSESSDYICLNQKCNRWNQIDLSFAKKVSKKWFEKFPADILTKEEDVIINSTGDGTVGRATLISKNYEGLMYDSHMLLVRFNREKIDPSFFVKFFNSYLGQKQVEYNISAKTTKQTELGISNLMKTEVPDISKDQQRGIVVFLEELSSKVKSVKNLLESTGKYINALMPSVLAKSFNGDL